jgi:hypothetical protein
MKKEIKIGNKTFEFENPNILDKSNKMKAKLIKQNGIGIQTIDGIDYYLILDGKTYHTNPLTSDLYNGGKLSKQNCDEIFGVVDFGKLANYEYPIGDDWSPEESLVRKLAFLNGVDKAMGLNKYKVFTLEDMELMFEFGYRKNDLIEITFEGGLNFIQSLQQPTEIDVEIVTETREWIKKLDSDGCLMLKKIESYE